MQNQQWLLIGFSTLLSGTLTSASLPIKNPMLPVAASTAGAMGASLVTKRREKETTEQLQDEIANSQNLFVEERSRLTLEKPKNPLIIPDPVIKKELPANNFLSNNLKTVEVIAEQPLETFPNAIAWLKAKQLTVTSYYQPQEIVDEISTRIATFLGERYNSLQLIYKRLKFNAKTGTRFAFKLAETSKEDISNCTRFCKLLSDHSFLAYYRYSSQEKTIIATPQTNNKISSFLMGGWFEWFVYLQVCQLLSKRGINYEALMNVKGTFANGNDYELDLVFLIDGKPLWIECKSGKDYNAYLKKYCQYRKTLGIPKERAFLVALELSDRQTIDYTPYWDITVANLNNFLEQIENNLGLSNCQEIQQKDENSELKLSKTFTLLRKKSLRPSPDCREAVIEKIIDLFTERDRELILTQISEEVHKNLSISKSKIDEIIRTLMRSQSFLNSNGKPIASYQDTIANLVSSDLDVLNKKCLDIYREAILSINPDYFNSPENLRDFNETVG
jgi:hypothetical protein